MTEMETLGINWQLPTRAYNSAKLKFPGGWEVVCFGSSNSIPKLIEIRGKNGGEFVIGGDLTVLRNGAQVFRKKNFKFVGSGPAFIKIRLDGADLRFRRTTTATSVLLKGVINITPVGELFGVTPPNFQMKINQLNSLSDLSTDFSKLLNPETSCIAPDVKLKCGNASMSAHKFVLSSRSPVFAAMLANPIRGNRQKKVVIDDIDVHVLRAMVAFMYTGKPSIRMTTASDLLFAAHKYQVLSLKRECCDFLKGNITLENVLFLLDLGDVIAKDLKSFAIDYLCHGCEFSEVQNSVAWKTLENKKPALAMEVLSVLVKSKNEKLKKFKAIYK